MQRYDKHPESSPMNASPRRICVFAGAHAGNLSAYSRKAVELGQALVRHGYDLVYGGGSVGLMGCIADSVLAAGGNVIGVIPDALARLELGHRNLTELHVVSTMHERKQRMAELAQGFVALPGGLGTLEELFEAVTWTQLGYHQKPVGICNCHGYFDGLVGFLSETVHAGFLAAAHAQLLIVDDDCDRLLSRLEDWPRSADVLP